MVKYGGWIRTKTFLNRHYNIITKEHLLGPACGVADHPPPRPVGSSFMVCVRRMIDLLTWAHCFWSCLHPVWTKVNRLAIRGDGTTFIFSTRIEVKVSLFKNYLSRSKSKLVKIYLSKK